MLTVIYTTEHAYVMTSGQDFNASNGAEYVTQLAQVAVLDLSPVTVTNVQSTHPASMDLVSVTPDGTISKTAQNGTALVTQPVIYVTAQSQMSVMNAKNMHSVTQMVSVNVKTNGILLLTALYSIKTSATSPVPHVMAQESTTVWIVSTTPTATTAESVNVTQTGVLLTVQCTPAHVTIAVQMDVPDQLPSTVTDAQETLLKSTVSVYAMRDGPAKTVPPGTEYVHQPVWNALAQLLMTVSAVSNTHGAKMVTVYVCQAGMNLLIAQSRPSSVTYHVKPALEPCRTNVPPVMTDLSLAEASVSLVTRPVRHVQPDQEPINAIPASKANLHLHQALVNAAI
jgi:hypothetical protein